MLPVLQHVRQLGLQALVSDHGDVVHLTDMHHERGEWAVKNQAAVLIDCENIAATYADSLQCFLLTDLLQQHACVDVLDLFGNEIALRHWQAVDLAYPFQYHVNQEGRNAADRLMQEEALTLANRGVRFLYLVSNDGGFAPTMSKLRANGLRVISLGNTLSHKLKTASSGFHMLSKHENVAETTSTFSQKADNVQGEQFMNDTPKSQDPFAFGITDSPSPESIQQALNLLYRRSTLPDYFPRLLNLFVEQTFRTLCLTEPESEMGCPSQSPSDAVEVLEAVEVDPLFQQVLLIGGGAQEQWRTVRTFAKRCDYAYMCGKEEAKIALGVYPQAFQTDLVNEHIKEKIARWHLSFSDIPLNYRSFFTSPLSVSEAEQVIMRRWYRCGFGITPNLEERRREI